MYRLFYINKYNEDEELFFDTYSKLEYNYSLCYFSKNILHAKGYKAVGLTWKIIKDLQF